MYELYGVISGVADVTATGDGNGPPVCAVSYRDISFVVSDSPDTVSPTDKDGVLKKLLAYQRVMETLVKERTVIPVKFGSRLKTKEDVEKVLEGGYSEFRKRLDEFEGKIEVDVTASWKDFGKAINEVVENDNAIKNLKEKIAGMPASKALAEKIKLGALIKVSIDMKREELFEKSAGILDAITVGSKRQEIQDDKSVFSAAFLLERSEEGLFYSALEELSERFEGKLNFSCLSPLPPYAFSILEIKRVGCEEVDRARSMLGLEEELSVEAVKRAYFTRTRECHPDVAREGVEKKFEEVTQAYRLLLSLSGKGCPVKSNSGDCLYIEPVRA